MVVLGDGFLSEERRKDISLPCLGFCRKRTDHDSRDDGILTEEKSRKWRRYPRVFDEWQTGGDEEVNLGRCERDLNRHLWQ
jgi:hypothetical protein